MLKSHIKSGVRNLWRRKWFSLISILGLSIGIACCLMVILLIKYELSFDRQHINRDQIYRVARLYHENGKKSALTPPPMAKALKDELPEIIDSVRIVRPRKVLIGFKDTFFMQDNVTLTDKNLLNIFSIPLLKGKKELASPDSVLISERVAKKFFGNQDPLGKTISYKEKTLLRVTGIFADMPVNSHFISDVIAPLDILFKEASYIKPESWGANCLYTYLLLKEGTNPDLVASKIKSSLMQDGRKGAKMGAFLQPLSQIHLFSHISSELSPNASVSTLVLFSIIALLILLIACINYINLSTALASFRSKEVGIRKVIGAPKNHIARQFFGEALLVTFFSMICALFITSLILPVFNRFIDRDLIFGVTDLLSLAPYLLFITGIVSLSAGFYPAIYLSNLKPSNILKGGGEGKLKGVGLRNILVVTQFIISLILILSTFIVNDQMNFIATTHMGFDREQILVVKLKDKEARKKISILKNELSGNSNVIAVSSSMNLPNEVDAATDANWPGKPKDRKVEIYLGAVDYDFVDLFGMKILMGRNFSRNFPEDQQGAFLINEAAMRVIGPQFKLGMEFAHWGRMAGKIVGVVKDFHMLSVHEKIEPMYYKLNPEAGPYLTLKIKKGNIPSALQAIEVTFKKFSPRYPFEYQFFNEVFDRAYLNEQKLQKTFTFYSIIAIFIACIGLFGLVAFLAVKRTREIGIRKIVGASIPDIFILFSKDIVKWLIFANLFAWPVAYYTMNSWLQTFSYKTPLYLSNFIISGGLVLLIALFTISFLVFKTASKNPADTLKHE